VLTVGVRHLCDAQGPGAGGRRSACRHIVNSELSESDRVGLSRAVSDPWEEGTETRVAGKASGAGADVHARQAAMTSMRHGPSEVLLGCKAVLPGTLGS
jgi:hypothetical protein